LLRGSEHPVGGNGETITHDVSVVPRDGRGQPESRLSRGRGSPTGPMTGRVSDTPTISA
jgi:hypothetical protein